MKKIKNSFLRKAKALALGIALLTFATGLLKAQTCSGGSASISPNGTTTINGINVTSVSTGFVVPYPGAPLSVCGTSGVFSPNSLWVGNNTGNPTGVDNANWQTVLTFSQPINDVVILLAATGSASNEKFSFTSNGGTISISSTNNCFTTISGNTLTSGLGSPLGNGGGGIFRLTAPASFTTLTMSGLGGTQGSVLALCSSSIAIPCPGAGTIEPSLSGTTLSNTCPAATVNLNSLYTGTAPGTSSLVWFNNPNHTGTQVSDPAAVSTSGTYYAFYYDSTNTCYSPASVPVVVTLNGCVAGVPAAVWYKADAAVYSNAGTTAAADNATVQQWDDQLGTGYNLIQATAAQRPTFSNQSTLANFNPTVTFNSAGHGTGQGGFMAADPGSGNNIINRAQGSIYIAGKMNTLGAAGLAGFYQDMDYPGLHISNNATTDKLLFYTEGSGYTTLSTNLFASQKPFVAGSSWLNAAGSTASNLLAKVWLDGNESIYNNTLVNVNTTNTFRAFRIGRDTDWGSHDGQMNEVIVFPNPLTAAEKARVDSYLSVKWGTTLTGDYVNSGNSIVWNATPAYQNNILGIAKDGVSVLNQKQSRSENANQKLIIGSGSLLANTNAANTNVLAEGQYLIAGDNGLKQGLTTPLAYTAGSNGAANFRFESIWKVQNTGNVGTVTVAWPKGVKNLYLVQSPDAIFDGADIYTPMTTEFTVNGVVYNTTNVTLANGQFFTFAGFGNAPGGVAGSLSYWYRADKNAASTGAGTDVTGWTDMWSGTISAQLGTNALPKYVSGTSAYFNFNPGINFTTVAQTLGNNTVRTLTSLNYDVFTFTKEGTSNSGGNPRIFSTGMDNTTMNDQNWDGFGIWPATYTALERRPYGGGTQYPNVSPAFDGSIPSIMYFRNTNIATSKGLNGAAMAASTAFSPVGSMFGGHIFGDTRFSSNNSDNAGFTGHIGETIIYGAGTLSDTERRRVDSYMAIKYGITLGRVATDHYLSADASVVWNGAANTTYNNNVFGVARDDIEAFQQKVSKSVNTGVILTVASTNDFVNPNQDAARTGFVNDKTYFLLGDNNTVATPLTAFTVAGNPAQRIQRIWLSQRTNTLGNLYFAADLSAYGSSFAAGNNVRMIVADDAAFTVNVKSVAGTFTGGIWVFSNSFDSDGTQRYITFAITACAAAAIAPPLN